MFKLHTEFFIFYFQKKLQKKNSLLQFSYIDGFRLAFFIITNNNNQKISEKIAIGKETKISDLKCVFFILLKKSSTKN